MQVLTSTGEHAELAAREISVMQSLRHPNLLPLLASEHKQIEDEESGISAFYMLFPLYPVQTASYAGLLMESIAWLLLKDLQLS